MEDLLLQAGNQSKPELWREPIPHSAQVKRAAGRNPETGPVSTPRARGGFFEHCSGTMAMSGALERLGYECLGGSEIDEHALDFQRRILGMTEVEPVGFWGDPVSRLVLKKAQARSSGGRAPVYRVLSGQRTEERCG